MSTMNRPNIVFVISDQHRFDWMGCAGTPFVRTPTMDRMAREGVRFTNCYCNAPLCGPARMALLTGRHPYRLGVFINEHSLSSDVPTMAHALSLAGYEAVLCGRMHFNGPDQRHGFEKRLVGDITRCYAGGPAVDFGDLRGSNVGGMTLLETAGPGDSTLLRYDEAVTRECERFLSERSAARSKRPLFLTVGWYGPHNPYRCPRDLFDGAAASMDHYGDSPIPLTEGSHPWVNDTRARRPYLSATPEQVRAGRAGYAGAIGVIDQLLGRVLTAAQSLPGETIVIYTSDHGEAAGDRGMWTKVSFYDNSARVPCIWTKLGTGQGTVKVPPGVTVDANVSLLDLPSTFADIVNAPPLPAQDGHSIVPLLEDPKRQSEAEWRERPVFADLELLMDPPMRMVRKGRYKLNYYHTYERPQLFDLETDPSEACDQASDPSYADTVAELTSLALDGWDPEAIWREAHAKDENLKYMTRWGREVGRGPDEIWRAPED